jgi:hypothetical protein
MDQPNVNANTFTSGAKNLIVELTIRDRRRLSDQLIHALFGHHAIAVLINVDTRRDGIDFSGPYRSGR